MKLDRRVAETRQKAAQQTRFQRPTFRMTRRPIVLFGDALWP
jgi:hypothetical protein